MKFKIVIALLIAMVLVIFALQNTEIVQIKLWFWEIQTPKALLILLCVAVGVIVGFMVPSPKRSKIKEINQEG